MPLTVLLDLRGREKSKQQNTGKNNAQAKDLGSIELTLFGEVKSEL